jgi:hypothetical protein
MQKKCRAARGDDDEVVMGGGEDEGSPKVESRGRATHEIGRCLFLAPGGSCKGARALHSGINWHQAATGQEVGAGAAVMGNHFSPHFG